MNQLLGNLTTSKMRLPQKKPSAREAAFKIEKKKEEKEDICSCSDEEEAKFVKKLDRGSAKYKGKLNFKCFNCGRVGHYAAKCPHKKERNQAQESEKTTSKNWQKGNKFNRKSYYVQQDNSASEDSDEPSSEEGTSKFLLMAIEELEGLLLED